MLFRNRKASIVASYGAVQATKFEPPGIDPGKGRQQVVETLRIPFQNILPSDQIIKIIIASFIAIIIFAIITGQSVAYYISGLGALTAVLLLVFQDTILSFVASVQIGQNDIIKIGDWIEVPEFGADGDVVDIVKFIKENHLHNG